MKGTCNWCTSIIKVEAGYNSLIHRRYCCVNCQKKDTWFNEYFSDENIGMRNYEQLGINNDPRSKQ